MTIPDNALESSSELSEGRRQRPTETNGGIQRAAGWFGTKGFQSGSWCSCSSSNDHHRRHVHGCGDTGALHVVFNGVTAFASGMDRSTPISEGPEYPGPSFYQLVFIHDAGGSPRRLIRAGDPILHRK